MASLTAAEINAIKARIKSEAQRRTGYGSLSEYGTSTYDFTETPVSGGIIKAEHGEKTVNILLKVKDFGGTTIVNAGDLIESSVTAENMQAVLTSMEGETMTASTSSCRGACTGICVGTCTSGCSGCT